MIPFLWRLRQRLARRRIAGVVSNMTGMNCMMLSAAIHGILRLPVVAVEQNDFLRNQNIDSILSSVMRHYAHRSCIFI